MLTIILTKFWLPAACMPGDHFSCCLTNGHWASPASIPNCELEHYFQENLGGVRHGLCIAPGDICSTEGGRSTATTVHGLKHSELELDLSVNTQEELMSLNADAETRWIAAQRNGGAVLSGI